MLYERVWLPTGQVLSPLSKQMSKDEADKLNAALAGQGIMNVRWKPVEQEEEEKVDPFPEARRMSRFGW